MPPCSRVRGILIAVVHADNLEEPGDVVGNDKDGDGCNEDPGLEVMPLPEEGHDNGNVAFDGERDGGVDRPRKCHLRDGHQIRGQMYVNVICMLK